MTSKLKLLVACSSVSVAMLCSAPAFAGGTAPGTDIVNTVNVNYQVNSVPQTVTTATNTFKVDRKIIFSLVEAVRTGPTLVTPGQADQSTRFQLTNTSNDTLDFGLTALQQVTTTVTAHVSGQGQDGFDLTGFSFFVDANANGTYEPATDTATAVDNLGPDQSLFIFIVGDVPLTTTNGQVAGVQLTATAREASGLAITAVTDATVNGATTVETVFADAAKSGVGGTSIARDGIDVATDSYTVSAATLSAFKTSRVISDGVSAVNFKAIPGAVVEYCISVTNTGGITANSIAVSDLVPANTTFVPASVRINAAVTTPGAGQTCAGGTAATDSAADLDGGSFGTPANTVVGALADIVAGGSSALIFRATIN